jgi:hypothetical protein
MTADNNPIFHHPEHLKFRSVTYTQTWMFRIFLNGSTALVGPGRFFSFLIYSQPVDSLDGWSARRTAST